MKKQNKAKKEFLFLIIGIILIFFGIYLSVFKKEPHFYTPFSIGMVLVSISVYRIFSKKKLFENWKIKNYVCFFFVLLISCIIIDRIGIYLGYWIDNYHSFFDN
ncbi:MAG: hypothetical protein P8X70_01710 [Nanoarchaeota archaeon]